MSHMTYRSVLIGLCAAAVATTTASPAVASTRVQWVGTWAASPVAGETTETCPAGPAGITNQTVRNIVHTSVGGNAVRVRLSNTFGTAALTVGSASVAVRQSGAASVPGTLRTLSFGGERAITIPPGAQALSDPVRLPVRAAQDLAVSVFVPRLTGPATYHPLAVQDSFLSGAGSGDTTARPDAAAYPTTISCWMFVAGVDVPKASRITGSVVALGDSITDGAGSATNANHRWPNILASRLADRVGRTLSVVDEGISANRVLSDAPAGFLAAGVNAQSRLDRDVLTQPGAKVVVLLEGINDIGFVGAGLADHPVTAAEIIAGYRQIIARSHDAGLRIVGGTLTPFKGTIFAGYWNEAAERIRQEVNRWIRTSGAFDGVVDFAAATASRDDPLTLNPAFDSGDHLHPNDAGYEAMANAIDLRLLLR